MSEARRLTLEQGAQLLGLVLSDAQVEQLLTFVDLIVKWNKVYNLTAVRDAGEMVTHHLLDSLAAVIPLRRHIGATSHRLLDVGSGAGLPGVVLAICNPGWQVDCVDTVGKKAAFIQQAAAELQLKQVRGVHARVETLTGPYDVICSRAFASLADFVAASRQALAEQGIWMALKGKHPTDELVALLSAATVFHVEQLQVPGLDAERCIVWMRRAAATQPGNARP